MMGPLPKRQTAMLEKSFKLERLWLSPDPEAHLQAIKDQVVGMVSTFESGASGRLIRALPNLEIIAHYAVGYDNVDLAAAQEKGIVVTHTPDVLTEDTADFAMALVLTVMRRMVEGDLYVRSGQWAKKGDLPLGRSPRGKTMGIVGLGRIGAAIAKRAEAFGMKVIYHNRNKRPDVAYDYYADVHEMAGASDVLMLSCPGGDETKNLVGATVLKALGRKGFVINIARGSVLDEQALIDALQSGQIAGAGLDVYAHEPDVPSALCHLDNVVLQPHQASATKETRAAMAQLVVDNLLGYFEKATVLTPVSS